MSAPTPGPWRVNGLRIECGPYVAGDGFCVAIVLRDEPEYEANAALIASAPTLTAVAGELLGALQALCKGFGDDKLSNPISLAALRLVERGENAIANAERAGVKV